MTSMVKQPSMRKYAELSAQRGWYVFPVHVPIFNDDDNCIGCTCEHYRRSDECKQKQPRMYLAPGQKCDQPGKCPAVRWTEKSTIDPAQIKRWWGHQWETTNVETGEKFRYWPNIGLDCGQSGILVLDEDKYKEVYGDLGDLLTPDEQETVRQLSGSHKGSHSFYAMPEGKEYSNATGDLPDGIDIRGAGGYVVLMPSLHKSGNRYEWIEGYGPDEIELQTVPEPLQAILDDAQQKSAAVKVEFSGATTEKPDLSQWRISQEIKDKINATPITGTRSETDYSVCLSLIYAGASDDEIRAVFQHYPIGTQGRYAEKGDSDLARTIGKARQFAVENPREETRKRCESDPYDIQDGCMGEWHKVTRKENGEIYTDYEFVPIADFWAKITGENTDEYGERMFVISGEGVRGGRFSFEIPALQFGEGGKLVAALEAHVGAFDPIHVGQQKHVGAAIKKLTSGELARSLVYTRTGWAGDKFLIPGREPENTQIRLARKLPFAFRYNADLAQGLQAFEALLAFMGSEVGPVVMSSLLLPPLANLAGWRNERYATFIKGRSGTHKTSTLQTAMCIYGENFARDEFLLKFGEGATRGAIMACATQAGDLPLPLDNYKPSTGGGANDFTNLIHNILEGGEKERLDRSARLKETKPIFTWPVCTGEDLPSDDPASLARILVVTFDARTRGDINHLSTAQGLSSHLPAIGAAWIEWLESDQGRSVVAEIGQGLPEKRNKMAQQLIKSFPKMVNPYRVATNIVINQLTWAIVCEHPSIGTIAKQYLQGHQKGIGAIAKSMAGYTANSLEANRFVQSLKELLAGGRLILLEKNHRVSEDARNVDHVVGWKNDLDGAYFLPELTIELVKRYSGDDFGNISRNALYEQLDQLGFLASKDKDQNTKSIKVQGQKTRVLHLSTAGLALGDDDAESS